LQQGLLGKVRFNVIGPKLQTLLRWPMGIVHLPYGRIIMETLLEAASLWAVSARDRTLLVTFRTILGQTWKNGIKLSVCSC